MKCPNCNLIMKLTYDKQLTKEGTFLVHIFQCPKCLKIKSFREEIEQ